jgi:vacuolar-type H+-ATPase subunit F/Vma7
MKNNQRMAFIGPKEYVNSMRFIGCQCFSSFNEEESLDLIEKLKQEDYALIFISQDVCPEEIGLDRVVVLPGMVKASDPQYLKQEIKKAIGGEIELK